MGAGSKYTVGNTGGSETVTLTVAQMPKHTHTASGEVSSATTGISIKSSGGGVLTTSNNNGSGYPSSSNGVVTNSGGLYENILIPVRNLSSSVVDNGHTHSVVISCSNNGSSQAHENRPPYYALCFIMRIQ